MHQAVVWINCNQRLWLHIASLCNRVTYIYIYIYVCVCVYYAAHTNALRVYLRFIWYKASHFPRISFVTRGHMLCWISNGYIIYRASHIGSVVLDVGIKGGPSNYIPQIVLAQHSSSYMCIILHPTSICSNMHYYILMCYMVHYITIRQYTICITFLYIHFIRELNPSMRHIINQIDIPLFRSMHEVPIYFTLAITRQSRCNLYFFIQQWNCFQ